MGGRRRSAASKPIPKKRPVLEKVFKCPRCSHFESAIVTIERNPKDKGEARAWVECKVCKAKEVFRKKVTYLTEHVDVMSYWLDRIEEEGDKASAAAQRKRMRPEPAKVDEEKALLEALDKDDDDDDDAAPPAAAAPAAAPARAPVNDDDDDDDQGFAEEEDEDDD